MNTRSRSVGILFFLILIAISAAIGGSLTDIIQPVHITSGQTDTILISDLFYAKKYALTFLPNAFVTTVFDGTSGRLAMRTDRNDFGATLLEFIHEGKKQCIPVIVTSGSRSQRLHTFTFRTDTAVRKVTVSGSFNNWNKERDQLRSETGKNIYQLSLPLDPGSYIYKFIVDGKEMLDPANPEKSPTGFDDFNSVLRIADMDSTRNFLHIGERRETGGGVSFSFIYENPLQTGALAAENVIALIDNSRINGRSLTLQGNTITVSFSKKELKGDRTIRMLVTRDGKNTNLQQVQLLNGVPAGASAGAASWDDGVIYSIMVDRFRDGDLTNDKPVVHDSIFVQANYQGGDFRGIIQKIDEGYFDSLGINIMWISPVNDNPDIAFREYPPPHRWYSGYHGYWPISATAVEEKFGTMKELKELIAKAHKHGIKILLDFVAHHVHIDHPFFKQHPEWFGTLDLPDGRKNLRLWDEFRLSTWFEPYMPSFDYSKSKEALRVVSDNAVWWLRETGADGFRHDAVKHVPNEFWRTLTRKIHEEIEIPRKTRVYQIGETFGDYNLIASYVNRGQLSAQFNFNLSYFAIPVFIEPDKSFASVDFHMKKSFSSFGYNNVMGNIMDSHDKVRFMAYADGAVASQGVDTREMAWHNPPVVHDPRSYEKAKLYFAYMLTIPGLPVIYYGSEFGMTGADDPDNRRMMRFGDALSVHEKKMLGDVRTMVAMRNHHPALRYGDFLTLQADNAVYAYIRSDMNERLLIVLNKDQSSKNVPLQLPAMYKVTSAVNITNRETVPVTGGRIIIPAGPVSWQVFRLQ